MDVKFARSHHCHYIRKMMQHVHVHCQRIKIHNHNFSIISSNCVGAKIYQEFGLPYKTPFVGVFLFAPCYIKLLKNFKKTLSSQMRFEKKSQYDEANNFRKNNKYYPIGYIGEGIEVHFLHSENEDECLRKWDRRLQRINWDNLYFSFTDRDLCTEEILWEFDTLPYKNKVCFTAKKYPELKSCVYLPEYAGFPYVGDIYTNFYICMRHFDVIGWLNGRLSRKTRGIGN